MARHERWWLVPLNNKPDIAISTLGTVADIGSIYLAATPFSLCRTMYDIAGAAADYWPLQPVHTNQAIFGLLTQKDLESIRSISSSFRAEKTWRATLSHQNPVLAVQSRLMLPHQDDLNAVQAVSKAIYRQTGKNVPVMLQENTSPEALWKLDVPISIQVTPENFGHFKDAPEVDTFKVENGTESLVFSTLHSRFLLGNPELFSAVVRASSTVGIDLGRSDIVRQNADPMADLVAVWNSDYTADIFKILEQVKIAGFGGTYVIKVPTSVLKYFVGNPQVVTPRHLTYAYKQLVRNLAKFLA